MRSRSTPGKTAQTDPWNHLLPQSLDGILPRGENHRVVDSVVKDQCDIKALRLWTHDESITARSSPEVVNPPPRSQNRPVQSPTGSWEFFGEGLGSTVKRIGEGLKGVVLFNFLEATVAKRGTIASF